VGAAAGTMLADAAAGAAVGAVVQLATRAAAAAVMLGRASCACKDSGSECTIMFGMSTTCDPPLELHGVQCLGHKTPAGGGTRPSWWHVVQRCNGAQCEAHKTPAGGGTRPSCWHTVQRMKE